MSKTVKEVLTETKAVAPKGTKTSEVILGTAVSKLGNGIKALSEMVLEISKLDERVNENTLLISDQEDKIAAKALELKNAAAQNKIELQQAYEANKVHFVKEWLTENNYQLISPEELNKLRRELAEAIANTDAIVKKEVGQVTGVMKAKHESELREKTLEFTATQAQNMAALTQKDEKINFLQSQVEHWRDALDKERTASVERAKAGSIQQTITSGK